MVVDPIDEIVDRNMLGVEGGRSTILRRAMLGVDGGINLHKKCGTNGGEEIIHDNCVHFSMYEVVYCNIDFILLMCLHSCTRVMRLLENFNFLRLFCNFNLDNSKAF
ncbi:hypothetical protein AHAS_Ahas06G0136600 [Arachis hypogaea]